MKSLTKIKLTEEEIIKIVNSNNNYEKSEYEAIIDAQLIKVADYILNITEYYDILIENDWVEMSLTQKHILFSVAKMIKKEIKNE